MTLIERYAALCERLGRPYQIFKETLWVEYQRMVVPWGPIKLDYLLSSEEATYLLARFPRALLVRTTSDFGEVSSSNWYAVICDQIPSFGEKSELCTQSRRQLRQALDRCVVRSVDAEWFSQNGYPVYAAAFQRYGSPPGYTEKEFRRTTELTRDFHDIVHYWAAFVGDVMIGYQKVYLFAPLELDMSVVKLHPAYLKARPDQALSYRILENYLSSDLVEYANNGFTTIFHHTQRQDFLVKRLGFRQVPLALQIHYRPLVRGLMRVTYPFRRLVGKLNPGLKSLYRLEEIHRSVQDK